MTAAVFPQPGAAAAVQTAGIRPLDASERLRILAWLDAGLRAGRTGRLAAEYPTLLADGEEAHHRILWCDGEPAAHAVARTLTMRADDAAVPVGMIGLVYTDPRFRRRGFATACIESCVAALRETGAVAALLWSDRHAFYGRLGFQPVGREWLTAVGRKELDAAASQLGVCEEVGHPTARDWPVLERLIARQGSFAERRPGDLERLAAAPACRVRVARSHGQAVAYAACGRGDDLGGVVHEWAGSPAGVVACIGALLDDSPERLVLSGADAPEPIPTLRRAGATSFPGSLALGRLLDPAGLWQSVVPDGLPVVAGGSDADPWLAAGDTRVSIEPADLLRCALGPELPRTVRDALPARALASLRCILPRPAFLWGFDSI